MVTRPWSNVDRVLGLGVALCGLSIVLLNSVAFAAQTREFATWWVVLACVVPSAQFVVALGWSQLPSAVLRAIWFAQPIVIFVTLLLIYRGWTGADSAPPSPRPWLLDSVAVAAMVLVVRLPYVIATALVLAAAVPLSAVIFLGALPSSVLSWGFTHCSNVIFVMIVLVLRQRMDSLSQANSVAEELREEEARTRAEANEFSRFSRVVHDEVLATFAAALHFDGEPPLLVRDSAAAALEALRCPGGGTETGSVELTTEDAAQLISDLIGTAAPDVKTVPKILPGRVQSAAVGAVGLAAAEAARNAARHAGGGNALVMVGRDSIRVSIIDFGPGFDSSRIDPRRFGIRESIFRRMEELPGGGVTLNSGTFGTMVVMEWNRLGV